MHDTKTGVDRAWPAYLMRRGPFCRTYPKLGGKFDSAPKKALPTDEMRITFSAHYSTATLTINKEKRIKMSCSDIIFQNNIGLFLKIITKHFFPCPLHIYIHFTHRILDYTRYNKKNRK